MGIFSKRGSKGFDPELWSDAKGRPRAEAGIDWTQPDEADGLDEIATNSGARFSDDDQAWLTDDPGEAVRNRKRES